MLRYWRSFEWVLISFISISTCTPHDYRHRIETTHQQRRYIYYCDTLERDQEGLFFRNSNGSIVRIHK